MGFFDKLLRGLGFADENELDELKPLPKSKNKNAVVGEYDLQNSNTGKELEKSNQTAQCNFVPNEQFLQENSTQKNAQRNAFKDKKVKKKTLTFAPQTQKEVESILENLKDGHDLIVKLSAFNENDIFRAMDFISGYCYCLNAKIKKINSDTFILELK